MKRSAAEILGECGLFPGVGRVNGVTFDGQHVWVASGDKLSALDPASGRTMRSIDVAIVRGAKDWTMNRRHLVTSPFNSANDPTNRVASNEMSMSDPRDRLHAHYPPHPPA